MKHVEINRTVQTEGVIERKEFGFKLNGKSYKTFISSLYKDKITAIIRELYSNGIDAQRTKKDAPPCLIHLPNSFEPYFSIRDYGISMSHEKIMTVYSTFFDSDKTDNNDDIGGLGLGAKTPLSYCELYTVTSYKNGIQNIYNIFYNERSIPEVNLMNTLETDEPDGIEVKFSVLKNDFSEFARKASSVFKYFDAQPNIIGADINILLPTYEKRGNGWAFDSSASESYVIMGGVAYPISDLLQFDLTPSQKAVVNSNTIFFFNVGDLEVAPSRESLSYDKKTQDILISRIDQMITEISDEVKSEIASCQTLMDARFKFAELVWGKYSQLKQILNSLDLSLFGKTISSEKITLYTPSGDLTNELDFKIMHLYISNYNDRGRYTSKGVLNAKEVTDIDLNSFKNVIFLLVDVKIKGFNTIIREFAEDSVGKKVFLIYNYFNTDKNITTFEEFKSNVGFDSNYTFQLVSSLRANYVPKVKPVYSKVGKWNGSGFVPTTIDINDPTPKYYVTSHYDKIIGNKGQLIELSKLKEMIDILDGMGVEIDSDSVFGLKKAFFRSDKVPENWINFMDYFFDSVRNYKPFHSAVKRLATVSYIKSKAQDVVKILQKFEPLKEKLPSTHALVESFIKVKDVVKDSKDDIMISKVDIDRIGYIFADVYCMSIEKFYPKRLKDNIDISAFTEFENIVKKYPIAEQNWRLSAYYYHDIEDDHLVEYIQAIDVFDEIKKKGIDIKIGV